MSGDRGLGVTKVCRGLILRGVAPVFPFRGFGQYTDAGQTRTEDFDEHGPRCGFCGVSLGGFRSSPAGSHSPRAVTDRSKEEGRFRGLFFFSD